MSNLEVQREYDRLHSCCPQCGHNKLETTTMGQILPPNATLDDKHFAICPICNIHDRNTVKILQAFCKCGWKGKVHSMVPKFRAKVVIKREQVPYRGREEGPIEYKPGLFELEVISCEGILPSKYNVGSTFELVLDD